jgi:hypothetical protein
VLSDYRNTGLPGDAFSTFFPHGTGDVTRPDRHHMVTMTEITRQSPAIDPTLLPLTNHNLWPHWGQNTAERHRVNSQTEYCVKQDCPFANATVEELRKVLRKQGPQFLVMTYLTNITGSNRYM